MNRPVNVTEVVAQLEFMNDRTAASTDAEMDGAFATLADYREGGVFVGNWAGTSEWERHPAGDEIVAVLDGSTTLVLLDEDGTEHPYPMAKGDLLVVPKGQWHRFVTPEQLKVFAVTPQPTDHSVDRPVSE